jgi:hypothetical protein
MQESTGKDGAKERIAQELTSAIGKANKANQLDIEQFASARKWLQKVPLARARFNFKTHDTVLIKTPR